ncbi:uncharacterized protein LOC142767783 [Rhipicephalus microplus]|uniref:uncharacterized protein LOC142767783 n=1 Tax=Rhipicephalus microplus TaxID=6941 RepID=UPI003F6A6527
MATMKLMPFTRLAVAVAVHIFLGILAHEKTRALAEAGKPFFDVDYDIPVTKSDDEREGETGNATLSTAPATEAVQTTDTESVPMRTAPKREAVTTPATEAVQTTDTESVPMRTAPKREAVTNPTAKKCNEKIEDKCKKLGQQCEEEDGFVGCNSKEPPTPISVS